MQQSVRAARRATEEGLRSAVHRSRPLSRAGVLERLFTAAFRGLVYPQIWEDPVVDLEALEIGPRGSRHHHRLGRMQRAVLSDRRPRRDRRRRPQRRACRPRPSQIGRVAASAQSRSVPAVLRQRQFARQRASLRRPSSPSRRSRHPRLLGRARDRRAPAHLAVHAQFLSSRPARALSWARGTRWRACTASIRASC